MAKKELSASWKTAAKTIYATFTILKEAGGKLPIREIIKKIEEKVEFTPSEKEILEPDTAIPVDDIRSLIGVINKEGDVGLFITSGRFTADAERAARDSRIRIELIDFERFIDFWRQFYNKLSDEDKNQLPLLPIYFLGTNE